MDGKKLRIQIGDMGQHGEGWGNAGFQGEANAGVLIKLLSWFIFCIRDTSVCIDIEDAAVIKSLYVKRSHVDVDGNYPVAICQK